MTFNQTESAFIENPVAGHSMRESGSLLDSSQRKVQVWLYVICLLIFAIILVGGATRLTDSGLSITEWKPIHGTIPPLNEAQWAVEFEKYKQIPEYILINNGMSLSEFKFIFWWEWGHRQLGRVIGLVAALGFIGFVASGALRGRLAWKTALIPMLVACQGAIGWWMVHSGLSERTDVSQYRLAAHLTLACVIFAYTLWLARGFAQTRFVGADYFSKYGSLLLIAVCLIQIALGGLVAGLNAGLAYNTWPMMDGNLIPSGLLVMEPLWLNLFENAKMVQFTHRMGAYFLLVIFISYAAMLTIRASSETNWNMAGSAWVLAGLVVIQAAIGIVTLVLQVPIDWALVHQGMAIVVLTKAIIHARAFWPKIA